MLFLSTSFRLSTPLPPPIYVFSVLPSLPLSPSLPSSPFSLSLFLSLPLVLLFLFLPLSPPRSFPLPSLPPSLPLAFSPSLPLSPYRHVSLSLCYKLHGNDYLLKIILVNYLQTSMSIQVEFGC